jgi:hypothetical protein
LKEIKVQGTGEVYEQYNDSLRSLQTNPGMQFQPKTLTEYFVQLYKHKIMMYAKKE